MSGDQRRAGILWKENDLPGIGAYKRIKGADFPLLLFVMVVLCAKAVAAQQRRHHAAVYRHCAATDRASYPKTCAASMRPPQTTYLFWSIKIPGANLLPAVTLCISLPINVNTSLSV